jgi:branched-chain amino acid transport system ATP-binding protein
MSDLSDVGDVGSTSAVGEDTAPLSLPPRRASKLDGITGGAIALPLVVMTALFAFDQFDTAAFGVLAPTIERVFNLSDSRFGFIVILNLSFVLLLAIPLGYVGDRLSRTKMVVFGGIIAGVFSFLTGLVGSVAWLIAARVGNGIGQLVNDPIHNSLLADYYPPEARPKVYSWHQNGLYIGAFVGPAVAGITSALFGWRWAFMILIVPIVATSLYALRLEEPRRGNTDDPDAAAEVEKERPVAFKEGARTLLAVKTLRRQYWSYVFIGAGVLPLAFIMPLYFKRAFDMGDVARGVVVSIDHGAQFLGVLLAGRLTQKWLGKDLGEPLRRAGMALTAVGVGVVVTALMPNVVLAIAASIITYFIGGLFYPPFLTTQALVSPARVRTLSFGFGSLFLVGGVWALWLIPGVASISDDHGIRWGLGVLAPYWLVGGAVLASAGRFVADDAARAFRILAATVTMRRQRMSAGEKSMLLTSGVDVAYDSVQVLFGVDFEVRQGEIVALLGTNGAGKSTLLKAISGLVDPVGGAIFFKGEDVTHLDGRAKARLGIVQMPGGRSVFPTLTVNECLRLAGWLHRKTDPEHVRRATAQALEYFPVLVDRGDTLAGNMSGGEQQMLGLAMAFISKPELLMIDELSLGLAPTIVSRLTEIVRAIHAQGTTIILVEQSVNVALTLAQRAVFMEKGEVRFSGPTKELLERGDILRSVFLEGAASAVGVEELEAKDAAELELAAKTKAAAQAKEPVAPDARTVLELDEVIVRFGGVRAVDEASFTLRDGEILGLIGPNGAGKTTVFDVISGFVKPMRGKVIFDGQDVTDWSPDHRARAGLGRSFQDARIFPSLTVAENIAVGLERHMDVRDPVACALGLPAVAASETDVAWKVADLIELLGLEAFRNKFVGELSTGSRRIVDLAMSIAHQPKVLILDEPSSGIAQRETEALGPLLLRIQREVGCAMLVIEHDMPLVTGIADTMIALELGRVIATGTPAEVVNHPTVVASYLGTDESVIARSGSLADVASA